MKKIQSKTKQRQIVEVNLQWNGIKRQKKKFWSELQWVYMERWTNLNYRWIFGDEAPFRWQDLDGVGNIWLLKCSKYLDDFLDRED